MTKNNRLIQNLIVIFLSDFSRDHCFLESADRNGFYHAIYHQVLCPFFYFFLFENVITLVQHSLLFCMKTNRIVFFVTKYSKCPELINEELATELGKLWYVYTGSEKQLSLDSYLKLCTIISHYKSSSNYVSLIEVE